LNSANRGAAPTGLISPLPLARVTLRRNATASDSAPRAVDPKGKSTSCFSLTRTSRVVKAEPQVTMDIDRAMKNPASVFGTPEALGESSELTAEQKRAVLLQWKDQLQQLQAADDEGMQRTEAPTGRTEDLLGRVTSVLSHI
jgi:hypothetical protein